MTTLFLRGRRFESEGFALVSVLLLVALMALLATMAATRARVEVKLSSNGSAGVQAEAGARSGVAYVEAAIEKAKFDPAKVKLAAPPTGADGGGAVTPEVGDAVGADGWTMGASSADDPLFAEDTRTKFTVKVTDECARVNINTASASVLKGLPGMTAELAACIIDWRDTNDDPQSGGAEKDWYAAQDPPTRPRNGPFQTVDELLMVKGMTKELFFGAPTTAPLRDLVTVWSSDPNLAADGQGRISLDSANLVRDLTSRLRLNQQDGRSLQTALAGWRRGTLAQFGQVLSGAQGRQLPEDLKKRVFDTVTGGQGGAVKGRVNVRTAPLAILEALVGKDPAAKIAEARTKKKFTSPWDVWNLIRTAPSAAAQIDNVALSTKQFRIESRGIAGPRSVGARVLVVADRTTAQWKNRYWATTP